MNGENKLQSPASKNGSILGKIADVPGKGLAVLAKLVDHIAPGLPEYARAPIIVLVVATILIISCLVICALGGLDRRTLLIFWVPVCLVLLVVLGFIVTMGIRNDRKNVGRYPAGDMVGENTIDLASRLDSEQKEIIRRFLRRAAEKVAEVLNLSPEIVRCNLFGRDEHDYMRMITDLTFQMDRPEELTIKMPVGYGSTGRCFKTSKPNIAVLDKDWGTNVIDDAELSKVHPDLKWIISVPVLAAAAQTRPMWVLSVDGLRERRPADDLRNAVSQMFKYSKTISLVVGQK